MPQTQAPIVVDFGDSQNAVGLTTIFGWTDYPVKYDALTLVISNEDSPTVGNPVDIILEVGSRGLKKSSHISYRATANKDEEASVTIELLWPHASDYVRAYAETSGPTVPFKWQLRGRQR